MNLYERVIRRLMRSVPLYPEVQTEYKDLTALIARLQPYYTGYDLIRIGPNGDGGYLVPDDIDNLSSCFSPGVSDISGFELEMVKRGVRCYLADYSVDGAAIQGDKIVFDKKHLGTKNDEKYMTLDSWLTKYDHDSGDLLLQMDIEGSEYEVLLNASDSVLSRFRIMVIEFHHLNMLYNSHCFRFIKSVFDRILRQFYVVHIHPNNYMQVEERQGVKIPPLMEFTFHRRDRSICLEPRNDFPHYLDRNNTSNDTITLPDNWYKK